METILKIGAAPTAAELRQIEQEGCGAERDVRVTRQQLAEFKAQKCQVEIEAGIVAPVEHPDELQKRIEAINREIHELERKLWAEKDKKSENAFSFSAGLTELRTRAALLSSSAAPHRPVLPAQAAARKSEATRRLSKINDELELLESRVQVFEQRLAEKRSRLAAIVKLRDEHPVYAEAKRINEKDIADAQEVARQILEASAELFTALDELEKVIVANDAGLRKHNAELIRIGLEQVAPDQQMRQFYFQQRDRATAMLRAFH